MNSVNPQLDPGLVFISDLADDLDNETLDLPAFPEVALRIKSALEDPKVTAEDVAKLISADPVFSAKIIKTANSVLINGMGPKIEDIRTAITRMGFKMAYNTAVSIAIAQLRSDDASDAITPYLEACWLHSVKVAAYSYVLAKKQERINPDTALLAGLLHDIGKFYILSRADYYPALFDTPHRLERILDDWHTGIGRGILEAWNFSEDLCTVADEHETLGRYTTNVDLTDIIMVANLFSHRDDDKDIPDLEWNDIPAAQQMNLSKDCAIDAICESEEEIQSIINALK